MFLLAYLRQKYGYPFKGFMKPFLEKAMDPQIVPDNLGGYFNALSGWFDFTMRWSRQKSHDFLGKTWRITRKYASNKTLLHIITTALNIYIHDIYGYMYFHVFPSKVPFLSTFNQSPPVLVLWHPPPFFHHSTWKARDLEEAQVAKQVQHPLAVPLGPGCGISIVLR